MKIYKDFFAVADDMEIAKMKGDLKKVFSIYRGLYGQKLSHNDKMALKLVKAIQSGNIDKVEKILTQENVDVNYKIPTEMDFDDVEERDANGRVTSLKTQPIIKYTSPIKFSKEISVYKEHLGMNNEKFVAINKLINEHGKEDETEEYSSPLLDL